MTITIRNSELEATIRRIGEQTGEEPACPILPDLASGEHAAAALTPKRFEAPVRKQALRTLRRGVTA